MKCIYGCELYTRIDGGAPGYFIIGPFEEEKMAKMMVEVINSKLEKLTEEEFETFISDITDSDVKEHYPTYGYREDIRHIPATLVKIPLFEGAYTKSEFLKKELDNISRSCENARKEEEEKERKINEMKSELRSSLIKQIKMSPNYATNKIIRDMLNPKYHPDTTLHNFEALVHLKYTVDGVDTKFSIKLVNYDGNCGAVPIINDERCDFNIDDDIENYKDSCAYDEYQERCIRSVMDKMANLGEYFVLEPTRRLSLLEIIIKHFVDYAIESERLIKDANISIEYAKEYVPKVKPFEPKKIMGKMKEL